MYRFLFNLTHIKDSNMSDISGILASILRKGFSTNNIYNMVNKPLFYYLIFVWKKGGGV